jgi:sugar phosphate isomerase/epimerase
MTLLLPISIQIYSLRNQNGLATQLDTVAAAGYRHVELTGSHLDDAAATRAALEARELQVSSSHVSLEALRERPAQVLEACKTLGFTQLFMPAVPPAERDSDGDYWLALGRELGAAAHRFADQGIALGYHNHHWELQPKAGGVNALELLFQGAADSPLSWQMDVAWLVRGGADRFAACERSGAHGRKARRGWLGGRRQRHSRLAHAGTRRSRRRCEVAGGRARQAQRSGALCAQ